MADENKKQEYVWPVELLENKDRAFLAHHHRLVRFARRTAGRERHEVRGECDRQPNPEEWYGRREALH